MLRRFILILLILFIGLTACTPPGSSGISPTTPPAPAAIVLNTVVPSPTVDIGINITQQEYMRALTTWQSQNIVEYEMRVKYSSFSAIMGIWTLRVGHQKDKDTVLAYNREPGFNPPTTGLGSPGLMPTAEPAISELKQDLELLTINYKFHDIETALAGKWKDSYSVSVQFDTTLGYPKQVDFDTKPMASEPSSWQISDFKVLR